MNMSAKKTLSVGEENFKDFINSGNYYVDKTLFIKDLLEKDTAT